VLHGGRGALNTVAFADGGAKIVAAGEDGTIRIWPCDVCGPIGDVVALATGARCARSRRNERREFLVRD